MVLHKYDVLLNKNGKGIISKIIMKVTGDKYHHSQLYIGNYMIVEDNIGGVKIKAIDKELGKFDAYRYRFKITKEQEERIDEFIQKSLNSKYDYKELFMQLFNKSDNSKNGKYICISLIVEAFRYAGIDMGDWKRGFEQISENPFFRKIN